MTSKQRKRERRLSGQTAMAITRHLDDDRQIAKLSSGKERPVGKHHAKQGKATIRHWIAQGFVGSGKWTSAPFHHGRTFIRKSLADGGCSTAL